MHIKMKCKLIQTGIKDVIMSVHTIFNDLLKKVYCIVYISLCVVWQYLFNNNIKHLPT